MSSMVWSSVSVATVPTSVGATVFGDLRLPLLLGAVSVSAMWLRAGLAAFVCNRTVRFRWPRRCVLDFTCGDVLLLVVELQACCSAKALTGVDAAFGGLLLIPKPPASNHSIPQLPPMRPMRLHPDVSGRPRSPFGTAAKTTHGPSPSLSPTQKKNNGWKTSVQLGGFGILGAGFGDVFLTSEKN